MIAEKRSCLTALSLLAFMVIAYSNVFAASPLPAPYLKSPSNWDANVSLTPNLDWSYVSGATSYRVQVSNNSNFSTSEDGKTCYNCTLNEATSRDSYDVPFGIFSCDKIYYWRVRAGNAEAGQGGIWSDTWSFSTQSCCTSPSTPTGLSANATGQTSINANWNAVSGAVNYKLFRDTSSSGSFDHQIYWGPNTSYSDSGSHLNCETTYYYKVLAENSCGMSGKSDFTSTKTQSCTPPPDTTKPTVFFSGLPGSIQAGGSVTINLQASDDRLLQIVHLEVADSSNTRRVDQIWDNVGSSSFNQNYTFSTGNFSAGTAYVALFAKDQAGNPNEYHGQFQVTAICNPPAIPTGLSASATGQTSISISWNSVSGATNYRLFRDTSSSGSFDHQIYWASSTFHNDSGSHLSCGTTYYYKVLAENSCGSMSDKSSTVSATTTCSNPVSVTLISPNTSATFHRQDSVTFQWDTSNATTSDSMTISMKRDSVLGSTSAPDGVNWYQFTTNTPNDLSETVTIPSTVAIANDWRFYVMHNASGKYDYSDQNMTVAESCTSPSTPTGLTASATGQTSINISWNSVSGATNYKVSRDTSSSGSFSTQVCSETGNSCTDNTDLSCGKTYYYKILAENNCGASDKSSAVSATTQTCSQTGPVAYYPFNGNANDESGNGNHGVLHGATLSVDRFGNANNAASFDGKNHYIQVPNSALLSFIDNFTFSLWFNLRSSGHQTLIAKSGDGKGLEIIAHPDGSIAVNNGYCCPIPSTGSFTIGSVNMNEWHMVTVTHGSGYITAFLDGVQRNQLLSSVFNLNPQMAKEPINIGIGQEARFYSLDGMIDDIHIYNRLLSESEVQELYKKEKPNDQATKYKIGVVLFNSVLISETVPMSNTVRKIPIEEMKGILDQIKTDIASEHPHREALGKEIDLVVQLEVRWKETELSTNEYNFEWFNDFANLIEERNMKWTPLLSPHDAPAFILKRYKQHKLRDMFAKIVSTQYLPFSPSSKIWGGMTSKWINRFIEEMIHGNHLGEGKAIEEILIGNEMTYPEKPLTSKDAFSLKAWKKIYPGERFPLQLDEGDKFQKFRADQLSYAINAMVQSAKTTLTANGFADIGLSSKLYPYVFPRDEWIDSDRFREDIYKGYTVQSLSFLSDQFAFFAIDTYPKPDNGSCGSDWMMRDEYDASFKYTEAHQKPIYVSEYNIPRSNECTYQLTEQDVYNAIMLGICKYNVKYFTFFAWNPTGADANREITTNQKLGLNLVFDSLESEQLESLCGKY